MTRMNRYRAHNNEKKERPYGTRRSRKGTGGTHSHRSKDARGGSDRFDPPKSESAPPQFRRREPGEPGGFDPSARAAAARSCKAPGGRILGTGDGGEALE